MLSVRQVSALELVDDLCFITKVNRFESCLWFPDVGGVTCSLDDYIHFSKAPDLCQRIISLSQAVGQVEHFKSKCPSIQSAPRFQLDWQMWYSLHRIASRIVPQSQSRYLSDRQTQWYILAHQLYSAVYCLIKHQAVLPGQSIVEIF